MRSKLGRIFMVGFLGMTIFTTNIGSSNVDAKTCEKIEKTTKSQLKQGKNSEEIEFPDNNDLENTINGNYGVFSEKSQNVRVRGLLNSTISSFINANRKPRKKSIKPPKATLAPTVEPEHMDSLSKDEMHVTVDTMMELLAYSEALSEGTIIQTLGYYTKGDGGGAKYEISNKGNGKVFSTCVTAVGQYANLVVENEFINIKQLGAGACEQIIYNVSDIVYNDDALRINEAIELVKDGKQGVVYFPEGEYRCASKVKVSGANYTIKGEGSKSIIYTDNGYVKGDEHFITIASAEHVVIEDIRVEARETWKVAYYRQCSIMYASDIQILNCEFSVKDNVIAYDGNADKQYTNVTLYTAWDNVIVDNCMLEQMGCVERGACIGIIDMWSEGCSNVSVTNCIMKHNAHDEMLGIFTKAGTNAGIKDIYIANNKMYAWSAENVTNKTMAITVAYDNSKSIENVVFKNNYVKAEIPSNLMTFGKINNCVVEDNQFEVVSTTGKNGVLFDTRTGVTIQNNNIKVSAIGDAAMSQVFKRYGVFIGNNVICDCYVYSFMYQGGTAKKNNIVLKKGCYALALDPKEFSENKVTVEGKMNNIAHYEDLGCDSLVSNNKISYTYDDSGVYSKEDIPFRGYAVYAGFHANINNYTVTFTENTVLAPNIVKSNKGMLSYGVDDKTPQNFIIKNNKMDVYKWVRNLYGQSLEGVVCEGNTDIEGNAYNLEDLLVMNFTSVEE